MLTYPQYSAADLGKYAVNSYMANCVAIGSKGDDGWAINPGEGQPAGQAGLFGPGPDGNEYAGGDYPAIGTSTTATQVAYPSELIMLSDGGTDEDAYWGILDASTCPNTANTQMDYCGDDFSATWKVLFAAVNYYEWTPITTFLREYNGTANYVMADSSAKSLHPGQLVEANLYINQHRWVVQPGN
jgi:hypothetical protein